MTDEEKAVVDTSAIWMALGQGLASLAMMPGSPRTSMLIDKIISRSPTHETLLKILEALGKNRNDVLGLIRSLEALWSATVLDSPAGTSAAD